MSPARIIAVVVSCQVLVFAGIFSFPALVPTFIDQWGLSNTQAGWISGIYFAGYVVSVLTLVRMTERVDARLIYAASAAVMSAAWFGFAFFAEGFWSALGLRFLGGVGFAGTYMPGLRAMLDRVDAVHNRLVVTLYMAGGALGGSVSFLLAGEIGDAFGWRAAFVVTGVAAFVASVLVAIFLQPVQKPSHQITSALSGVLGVFRNRRALGYVLAYGAHNWEVYTLNSWVVALLVFNLGVGDPLEPWITPTTVGTVIGVLAIPAILGGGTLSTRFGDRRVVSFIMLLSAAGACVVGTLAGATYSVLVAVLLAYTFLIYADSPGLTSGAIFASKNGEAGDVMALHTLAGHFTAAVGPPAFGLVLDLTGGGAQTHSWTIAFLCMAAVVVLGPVCLRWSVRARAPAS
ncbi:MAG: MFS transporter [Candidatus Tectomicrobia bacterium]|nr:MFS transporter [Candidatus Tectomicrobia bacterium]